MSNTHEAKAIAAVIKQHVTQAFAGMKDFFTKEQERHKEELLKQVVVAAEKVLKENMPAEARDGRDALDLEIMPSIDFEKSYPRGTYAQHKGGLWKSYQKTEGKKGWDCLVCGIDNIEIKTAEDARLVSIEIETSTGKQVKQFRMPVTKYKGVFSSKAHYEEGDMVTWGGNIYHCKGEPRGVALVNNEFPHPDNPEFWQLAVKRGRDGKDVARIGVKP